MAHSRPAEEGLFQSLGKAVDESIAMAEALREGKLTRAQFDAWYERRSAATADLLVNLRRRTTRLMDPVASALERGRRALRSADFPPSRRRQRRRPRGPFSARAAARLS